ncbi:MAG: insulinase family protein [Holophagales bacterium]|nr:insulinase family protein [Holophagales bacterium]
MFPSQPLSSPRPGAPLTVRADRVRRRAPTLSSLFALLAALLVIAPVAAQEPSAAQGEVPREAAREAPPEGGAPKDFALPERHAFELDNGLGATLVPFGRVPMVQMRVVVRTGNIDEGKDEVWLSDLTGRLMNEGAGDRDAEALAGAFAALGGELNVSVGLDTTAVSSGALAELAPELVALLADVVIRPALPESELERTKNDLARNVSVARSQPRSIASEILAEQLYGEHPYGRLFPSETSLRELGIEQVRAFHARAFGAARTHVYVVGAFDRAAVEAAVRGAFGGFEAGDPPTVNIPQPGSERKILLVDRPGAQQSTVRIALPVIDPSHADSLPLQVMNTLLGGSFASRITSNIREDKGYTYSPSSNTSARYRNAYWAMNADITTADTGAALKEIFYEIDRLQGEAPPEKELRGIQSYLAGSFVRRNSNPFGIAFQMFYIHFHGLGDDYLPTYVQRVHAVTPEKVQEMTRKYLREEDMLLVVVGDAAKIRGQLEPYGKIVDVAPPTG